MAATSITTLDGPTNPRLRGQPIRPPRGTQMGNREKGRADARVQELIERVRAAPGPDREIDFCVGEIVLGFERCKEHLLAGGVCNEVHAADHYTSSVDAIT